MESKKLNKELSEEIRNYLRKEIPENMQHELDDLLIRIDESDDLLLMAIDKYFSPMPLGMTVAESKDRNFLFTYMTANAVLEQKKMGNQSRVVELGAGTGLNCLAALIAGADSVLGIEKDEKTFDYATKLRKTFPDLMGKYNLVRGDFLKYDFSENKFDVVVNENLSFCLCSEPQLAAAIAVSKNIEDTTILVPDKIQFKVKNGEQSGELKPIKFDGKYGNSLERSVFTEIGPHNLTLKLGVEAKLLDYNGKTVVDYGQHIPKLPLGKLDIVYYTQRPGECEIGLRWDPKNPCNELNNVIGVY
jgi:SAM-dependent methyltransferase